MQVPVPVLFAALVALAQTDRARGLSREPSRATFVANHPALAARHHHAVLTVTAHRDRSGTSDETNLMFIAESSRQEFRIIHNRDWTRGMIGQRRLECRALQRVVATMGAHGHRCNFGAFGKLAGNRQKRRVVGLTAEEIGLSLEETN